MQHLHIPRRLFYFERDQKFDLAQEDLLLRAEPMVVLGEAGMGKTSLLQSLATETRVYCSAGRFLDSQNLEGFRTAELLLIDALDEVAERATGDTVSRILSRLELLGYPRFILSCRVADWRSATATGAIREHYAGKKALELNLAPLSEPEQIEFLAAHMGLQRAQEVAAHVARHGLAGWLGNPQTLKMLADIRTNQPLPNTRADLFGMAVRNLVMEHSDIKADRLQAPDELLSAAAAACAAMVLGGFDAIAIKAAANVQAGEITLAALQRLPNGSQIRAALDTRLFQGAQPGCFTYLHRSIAEYLGARWLLQMASTDRLRQRILNMFTHAGLVPASLRGMCAWLAQDARLSNDVIELDPLGFLEYGATDNLTPAQGRCLLKALQSMEERNPRALYRRDLAAQGIAQAAHTQELADVLMNHGHANFGVKIFVLDSLKGSDLVGALKPQLLHVFADAADAYASRFAAAQLLKEVLGANEWPPLLQNLEQAGGEDNLRLAMETLALLSGGVPAAQLISLVHAYASVNSPMAGKFLGLERCLSAHEASEFLSLMTERLHASPLEDASMEMYELATPMYMLTVKALQANPHLPWLQWLEPYRHHHATEDAKQALHDVLASSPAVRSNTLKRCLLGEGADPWASYWSMRDVCPALICSDADVVQLLAELDPANAADLRWRDVCQLVPHDETHGAAVRAAAQAFVTGNEEDAAWLERLAEPRPFELQMKQDAEARKERDAEKERQRHEFYEARKESLQLGEFTAVRDPARAYWDVLSKPVELSGAERLAAWLNPELAQLALAGFEAFMTQHMAQTAADIALVHAESQGYWSEYIVMAALTERLGGAVGWNDLSDEQLTVAWVTAWTHTLGESDALRGALTAALTQRDLLRRAVQVLCEPMLNPEAKTVQTLKDVLRSKSCSAVTRDLALEWIQQPGLQIEVERLLVAKLLAAQDLRLPGLTVQRGATGSSHALLWQAVAFVVDFDAIQASWREPDPELLWEFRDLEEELRRHESGIDWAPQQLALPVSSFRKNWPMVGWPKDGISGCRSGRDACEWLEGVMGRLASQTSPEVHGLLEQLCTVQDGYTEKLKQLKAEHMRLMVEASFKPLSVGELAACVKDQAPISIRDLQWWVLHALATAQAKIRGNDTDVWRGFYADDGAPLDEELCRNRLLDLLRQGVNAVSYLPETHVAADKRVDITCTLGVMRLPIEIKGQWHEEVWTAADAQLDRLYTPDWQAAGLGIYLVLWFGARGKNLKSPGAGVQRPSSPDELKAMLEARSTAVQQGRVAVVVLDLARE